MKRTQANADTNKGNAMRAIETIGRAIAATFNFVIDGLFGFLDETGRYN